MWLPCDSTECWALIVIQSQYLWLKKKQDGYSHNTKLVLRDTWETKYVCKITKRFTIYPHMLHIRVWVTSFCDENFNFISCVWEENLRDWWEKNSVDDRLLSRCGFTGVPQQSACTSWVEGRGRRLFEETTDPLNVQLRLIKGHRSNGKTLT